MCLDFGDISTGDGRESFSPVAMRAGIALGSNLGDRLGHLKAARQQITILHSFQPPLLASSAYETEPVNCEPNAPMFLNAVMEIGYTGAAIDLLCELRRIEGSRGRPSFHASNFSRTLDLDLLYFGDEMISGPDLELPHPRLRERRFVLEPLAEIRADLVLPSATENVAALLRRLPESSPLLRVASEW